MRLIDADELLKWILGQSKSPSCPKNESAFGLRIIKHIDRMPSAQQEIIRCKDCKYWQDQEEGIVEVPICARPQNKYEKFPLVMLIDGDGFCSFGKRRENE